MRKGVRQRLCSPVRKTPTARRPTRRHADWIYAASSAQDPCSQWDPLRNARRAIGIAPDKEVRNEHRRFPERAAARRSARG